MSRLLMLASMLATLHFGGASAICQDVQDAYQFAHSSINLLSNQVTSDIVNLHNSLPDSAATNS